MKKIICALLILVLLCSCTSKGRVTVINRNLSYKAHIFYAEKEYSVLCDIGENGADYKVVEGQAEGFGARVDSNGVRLYYDDLENQKLHNDFSVFKILYDTVCFFDGEGEETENDDENICVKGETQFGAFELLITESGFPISMTFENGEFFADFYDITLKN